MPERWDVVNYGKIWVLDGISMGKHGVIMGL